MSHKEVPVKVNAWIDEGVAELVEALNACESIFTLSSCEGYGDEPAHVFFRYVGSVACAMKFYAHFGKRLAGQDEFQFTFELAWRPGYEDPIAKLEVPRADVHRSAHWLQSTLAAAV